MARSTKVEGVDQQAIENDIFFSIVSKATAAVLKGTNSPQLRSAAKVLDHAADQRFRRMINTVQQARSQQYNDIMADLGISRI